MAAQSLTVVVRPIIDQQKFYYEHDPSFSAYEARVAEVTEDASISQIYVDGHVNPPTSTQTEELQLNPGTVDLYQDLPDEQVLNDDVQPKFTIQEVFQNAHNISQLSQRSEPELVSAEDLYELLPVPLQQLLQLKQPAEKDLSDYFNTLADIASGSPYDSELESIYLRRFIQGIHQDLERQFVEKWLQSGRFSLQDIRDAVLLLSKWPPASLHGNQRKVVHPRSENMPTNVSQDRLDWDASFGLQRNEHVKQHRLSEAQEHNTQSRHQQRTKRVIEAKPNVITRAAAASQSHAVTAMDVTTALTPGRRYKAKPKTTKAKRQTKPKKQKPQKKKPADITEENAKNRTATKGNLSRKRARQDFENDLRDVPQTPSDEIQHDGRPAVPRKRTMTVSHFDNVNANYLSSPPVVINVPQSSPLQSRHRRKPQLLKSRLAH